MGDRDSEKTLRGAFQRKCLDLEPIRVEEAVVSASESPRAPVTVSPAPLNLPHGGATIDKAGMSHWFAEEVQPHENSLRSYLRCVFPSLPDIDDLVQESYARLIRAREAGRVSYAKAFLFTTARNAALDFFRRRKVVAIDGIADLEELSVVEDRPDVTEAVNKQQELEMLAEAVRALPERCCQVMTLRLLYGMAHKEIAAELRISEHTVKAQLAKGMRRCAEYLTARGLP
jgi:RNA polymerase sigma factor (sigma-70 family)